MYKQILRNILALALGLAIGFVAVTTFVNSRNSDGDKVAGAYQQAAGEAVPYPDYKPRTLYIYLCGDDGKVVSQYKANHISPVDPTIKKSGVQEPTTFYKNRNPDHSGCSYALSPKKDSGAVLLSTYGRIYFYEVGTEPAVLRTWNKGHLVSSKPLAVDEQGMVTSKCLVHKPTPNC